MKHEAMVLKVQKKQASFKRTRVKDGPDVVAGSFFLLIDVSATNETLFIPISIASGKKPTGFVYQIEGTGEATISTTDISCKGDKLSQVRLGTLVYAKIPVGTTGTFRIIIEMRGKVGKSYKIMIAKINYKHDPSDARYQVLQKDISTNYLKFK